MHGWTRQSDFTAPGRHAEAFAAVGSTPEQIAAAIQGLLVHGEAAERYGLAARPFSRQTLPVEQRLAEILAVDGRALNLERALEDRAPGTCRDYALLTCAALRQAGQPARVRCGFAAYFAPDAWQDHWICEAWTGDRWRRIDAQLDGVTRAALEIRFDHLDLPPDAYLTADEAWRACRAGRIDPGALGHDEARGLWFAYVNLVRDRLALADRITSAWDGWRATASAPPIPNPAKLAEGDQLALDDAATSDAEPW